MQTKGVFSRNLGFYLSKLSEFTCFQGFLPIILGFYAVKHLLPLGLPMHICYLDEAACSARPIWHEGKATHPPQDQSAPVQEESGAQSQISHKEIPQPNTLLIS